MGTAHGRIAVIGDSLLDAYYDVVPAEWDAGIGADAHKIIDGRICAGGAANVAVAVAGSGESAELYSLVGQDEAGLRLVSLLQGWDVRTDSVGTAAEYQTRVLARFLGRGSNLPVRIDYRGVMPLDFGAKSRTVQDARNYWSGLPDNLARVHDGVIVADYGGLLTEQAAKAIAESCLLRNIPLLVDPSRGNLRWYQGCSIVQLNRKEVERWAGEALLTEASVVNAARKLRSECKAEIAAVTLSEKGAVVVSERGAISAESHASSSEVANTTGAGDAFAAGFMTGYLKNADPDSALTSALAAARRAVMTSCTCPVA
jgi:rfaE bifunctional protein kinase chain/domain